MGRARNGTVGHELGRARNGTGTKWPGTKWPARNGSARNGRARNGIQPYKGFQIIYLRNFGFWYAFYPKKLLKIEILFLIRHLHLGKVPT